MRNSRASYSAARRSLERTACITCPLCGLASADPKGWCANCHGHTAKPAPFKDARWVLFDTRQRPGAFARLIRGNLENGSTYESGTWGLFYYDATLERFVEAVVWWS